MHHWGSEAIHKMLGVLDESVIEGVTTIPFQKQILADSMFISGNYNTNFLNTFQYKELDNEWIKKIYYLQKNTNGLDVNEYEAL